MNQADPVVIANGVVFGFGNGEDATQATVDIGLAYNTGENRIARSTHAELHALDARTGEELWSSGDPDHLVQPLHQPVGRQRPRLHRHVRRHALRFGVDRPAADTMSRGIQSGGRKTDKRVTK